MADFKNNLLKRREVTVTMNFNGNPGFQNAIKVISNDFKAAEELIAIKAVKSKFGRDTFLIDAFIYDSLKDKERIEPKKKVKKTEMEAKK